jgi:hypothetical protein
MSLRTNDTDGGTWGIAMTSHGPLAMISSTPLGGPYFTGRTQLMPLGSKTAIKSYIDGLLLKARRDNNGTLPGVVEYEVAGVPNARLMVPRSLGSATCLALAEVARQGLGAVEGITSALEDSSYAQQTATFEARWRREHPDAEERDVRAAIAEHNEGREPNPAGMTTALEQLLVTPVSGEGVTPAEARSTVASAQATFRADTYRVNSSAMTGAQHYAALSTVLGSIAECAVDAAAGSVEAQESADLDLTVRILNVVASVCEGIVGVAGTALAATGYGAIVVAVLEILALVCRFINWILDEIREYTIDQVEGWNASWDGRDCTLILQERLRILVQIEETIIGRGPEGWAKYWDQAMDDLGVEESQRFIMLTNYIYLTARNRDRAEPGLMFANAKGIAQLLGGRDATKSLNMCDDIANWLGYVGVKPEDCAAVRTWLYESRKVTVVRKRRTDLGTWVSAGTHRGSGTTLGEYRGNMVSYVGLGPTGAASCEGDPDNQCNILGGERSRCQVNFRAGTEGWYRDCCHLDIPAGEFVNFELNDLKELWDDMRDRLRVVPFRGLNTRLPRGIFKNFLLTAPRKTALIKMLAPGATAEQIARCGVLNISAPGMAAMVLRDVPDSSLAPGVAAQTRLLNVGSESVRLWTSRDGFGVGGGGLPFYLHVMPADVSAGIAAGTPVEPLPAGSLTQLNRLSDAQLRTLLWQQMGIGVDPNRQGAGGTSSGRGGVVIAGLGVAAVVAAAILIK